MLIDLGCILLLALAIIKGFSKGFIVAVFSLLAFIIGLAAALKLSAVVAEHLQQKFEVSGYWLPVISFSIVFIGVVLLVKWGAAFIKKGISFVMLGWVDTIAGILLFAVMYMMIYSVILFFATNVNLISAEMQDSSKTYSIIAPFGPKVMSGLGQVIPFFSDMFSQLTGFFDEASKADPVQSK